MNNGVKGHLQKSFCQIFLRRIISTIYKELKNLVYPQIKDLIKKWASQVDRHSSEEIQVAKNFVKIFIIAGC